MNYTDIKQVFPSTSSLTMASYFTKNEQNSLLSDVTLFNFPFGKSEKDSIEISVFSFDGTKISSSYFDPTGIHVPHTKSYYDVTNKFTEYSYTSYESDLVLVGDQTRSVFFDVGAQLVTMSIQVGNYQLGIELMRDIVGSHKNQSQRLMIDSISPSRTEISVIPISLKSDNTPVNDEFYAFAYGKVLLQDVTEQLLEKISKPEIYNIYYAVAGVLPTEANSFKFNYGFSTNLEAINLVTDLYYGVRKGNRRSNGQISTNDVLGIYDQFSNWLYQNYNNSTTFQEIRDQYYSLFRFIIDQELNRITNKKPDDYSSVIEFLETIYYNIIFFPQISSVETVHVNYISGYFKNFINLGDGRILPIMNTKVIPSSDPVFHDKLIIKLKEALPSEIKVGYSFWITNTFASDPILQNVYFFEKSVINIVKLRGPNFLAKFESEGNSTETLSIEELVSETGSLYDELISKLNTKSSSSINNLVDYRYFENFVNFSSADIRISTFDIKAASLIQINENIQDLTAKLILQPDDSFYQREKQEALDASNTIKASFDGYESFLYLNPSWYNEHTNLYNGVSSASLYDRDNQNSLINNVPGFMIEDSSNDDYVKFVGMIGHYFDNLSMFIKQFTKKNDSSSSPNQGVSMDLVHDALVSLGWDPEISRENLPLLLSTFSKADFSSDSPLYSKVGNISESDRNKLIWKRILNSLPFIYKTKGTKSSINAIISCFGIPKNLLKVKEYGGIDDTSNIDSPSTFVFEESKYEPYFSGSGEYFQVPWTGSVDSIEFDVRFDPTKISSEGQVFRLVSNDNNWVLGVYRDRGEVWGKVFVSVGDGSGSVLTSMTGKAPLFDGNAYTVMFRKDDLNRPYGYPIEYELMVKKSDAGRVVFSASSSLILSGSYNDVYESGSNLYFGNYQQSTSSFGIDPEAFWGNLDEIKLWEIPVDNHSMEGHALYRGGYNYSDPSTMVDKLLTRISFNQPINLHTSSLVMPLNNISFRKDFPNFWAVNFPERSDLSDLYPECDIPDANPVYPYQFSINNIIQSAKVSSYGSATMRSNKIAHIDQTFVASLSSEARSTQNSTYESPIDSNKVGVFFSPIDYQNEEIMKFFGDYNFGNLIGDPALLYQSNYREFERFRELYYSKGFGIVDYQSFMNLVKSYFDKAMFKYIKTMVPARTKLVDGLLIEPSMLERPKIKLKPVVRENIKQSIGNIDFKETISAKSLTQSTASISIGHVGQSIVNDINHRFYGDSPESIGFGVYSKDGIAYYNNDYYRVDITKVKKSYQTKRKYILSGSQLNDYEQNINLAGTVQTISRSYYQLNLIHLPIVSEYIITASQTLGPLSVYFTGNLNTSLGPTGPVVNVPVAFTHILSGSMTGSMIGFKHQEPPISTIGTIILPLVMSATAVPNGSMLYTGYFNSVGNVFSGSITIPVNSSVYTTFYSNVVTGSIYSELLVKTLPNGLFTGVREIQRRTEKSLLVVPQDRKLLNGYFSTHYKYKKQVFSSKEINAYDQVGGAFKWKRSSQNKKTTVDSATGNLNNSDPIEQKTA